MRSAPTPGEWCRIPQPELRSAARRQAVHAECPAATGGSVGRTRTSLTSPSLQPARTRTMPCLPTCGPTASSGPGAQACRRPDPARTPRAEVFSPTCPTRTAEGAGTAPCRDTTSRLGGTPTAPTISRTATTLSRALPLKASGTDALASAPGAAARGSPSRAADPKSARGAERLRTGEEARERLSSVRRGDLLP